MKKYKIFTLLTIAAMGVASSSFAQTNATNSALNKSVEVVKQYTPTIGSSIKLDIEPQEVSRLVLDAPQFDYSIAYKPQPYMPKFSQLESFNVSTSDIYNIHKGYAYAAIGAPLQSSLGGYYTTNPKKNLFLGVFARHYGFWGDLKNMEGVQKSASETRNIVGVDLLYKKNRLIIDADASYKFSSYSKYGDLFNPQTLNPDSGDYVEEIEKNKFNSANLSVMATTPYNDEALWNGYFGTYANFFSTIGNYNETAINLQGGLARDFEDGVHRISLDLEYMYVDGLHTKNIGSETTNVDYNTFIPELGYRLKLGRSEVHAAASILISPYENDRFLPTVTYKYKSTNFNIEGGVRSDNRYSTFNNVSSDNPYIMTNQDCFANNAWRDYYIGISGNIGAFFTYSIDGGYREEYNRAMFIDTYGANGTAVGYVSGDYGFVTVNGSLLVMDKLTASVNYTYNSLELPTYAKHEFDFGLKYKPTIKWIFNLNAEVNSSRYFMVANESDFANPISVEPVNAKFDLSLGGEYLISKTFSLTASINNIFNSKMYKYYGYRGLGINGLVGITAKF